MIDAQPAIVDGGASPLADGFQQPGGLPAVPIVLGVVGHREVAAEHRQAVADQLRWVFERFRGADSRTPLVLLTGMAEGADQIAAEVALDLGWVHVRAVLPFERKVYGTSTSFATEGARSRLGQILDTAGVESFVVPMPYAADWARVAVEKDDPELKKQRHECYANVGGYIVRRSHALIAILDGRDRGERGPSGTFEHVQLKLTGQAPKHYPWVDDEPLGFRGERGLVFSIECPKASGDYDRPPSRPAGSLTLLTPARDDVGGGPGWVEAPAGWADQFARPVSRGERFWRRVWGSLGIGAKAAEGARGELMQFRELCQSVRDFNEDVAEDGVADKIRDRLKANAKGHDVPEFTPENRAQFARLSRIREAAAGLSTHLQPTHDNFYFWLFLLIFAGATFFHLYAHLVVEDPAGGSHPIHWAPWLAMFAVAIASALVLVGHDWWFRLDQRRLDARALGEGLRVRQVWAEAGISLSVADCYAGQLRGELTWIRHALLHVCPPPRVWALQFEALDDARKIELLTRVREKWITGGGGQIRQFRRQHERMHRNAAGLRRSGFVLALIGWLLAGLLLVPRDWPWPAKAAPARAHDPTGDAPAGFGPRFPGPAHSSDTILIASSLMVILGGLMIGFNERQAYEELARQYERMALVFRNGDIEFQRHLAVGDHAKARRVIEALGREAIIEHTEWYLLRRSRALELPFG